MRVALLTLAAAFVLAAAAGCGGAPAQTHLEIKSYSTELKRVGPNMFQVVDGKPVTFSLRCEPAGGTLPKADLACRLLDRYPRAMLFRITRDDGVYHARCSGAIEQPVIEFEGAVRGEEVEGAASKCGDQVGFDMWRSTLAPHG